MARKKEAKKFGAGKMNKAKNAPVTAEAKENALVEKTNGTVAENNPKAKADTRTMTEGPRAAEAEHKHDKILEGKTAPKLILQYQGAEIDVARLVEAAEAELKAKQTQVVDLTLYLKPEDRAAYYVANEDISGKIAF